MRDAINDDIVLRGIGHFRDPDIDELSEHTLVHFVDPRNEGAGK